MIITVNNPKIVIKDSVFDDIEDTLISEWKFNSISDAENFIESITMEYPGIRYMRWG